MLVCMNREDVNGAVVNEARLLLPSFAVAEASFEQLRRRLKSTVRVQNQAAAIRAEVLSEMRRRKGTELVERVLREDGLLGRRRARSEVETARELEGLPKIREGLGRGEISYDNVRILAGASQRGQIDEDELLDAARTQTPDKFAGTVRKYEQARSVDDGVSRLEHQRSRRWFLI